jgi:hypothetical protein
MDGAESPGSRLRRGICGAVTFGGAGQSSLDGAGPPRGCSPQERQTGFCRGSLAGGASRERIRLTGRSPQFGDRVPGLG